MRWNWASNFAGSSISSCRRLGWTSVKGSVPVRSAGADQSIAATRGMASAAIGSQRLRTASASSNAVSAISSPESAYVPISGKVRAAPARSEGPSSMSESGAQA